MNYSPTHLMKVHPTTQQVFNACVEHARQHHGVPPTRRQLMERTGIRSTSQVFYHLKKLVALDWIRTDSTNSSIEIVGARWEYTGPHYQPNI